MKRYISVLLKFCAITLIIIVLIEVFFVIIRAPKISYHNISAKSQNLIPKINSKSILFLGDSRIEWGIKPVDIKKKLKLEDDINVINLAMPNSNGLDILSYLKQKNIFPKIIILGYTNNYGRYTNHDLDNERYYMIKKYIENCKYFLMQHSFLYDRNSIKQYFEGIPPLHMKHEYDKLGGVNVRLYGDYNSKRDDQIKIYTNWRNEFSEEKLDNYHLAIKQFKHWFAKGGTEIYGLKMPASKELNSLEPRNGSYRNISKIYDKIYDYSDLKYPDKEHQIDSIYFMDGSHLTRHYSVIFSQIFAKALIKEIN